MKKMLCFLLVVTLTAACTKEKAAFQKTITGTWELERRLSWVVLPPVTPGEHTIVLQNDGGFQRKKGDTVLFSGTYWVQDKKDCSGDVQHFFYTTEAGYQDNIATVSGDELVIANSSCLIDGGGAVYKRKK